MKDLRTIILAAGKGTRMKSAVPKVLHEAGGKPLIDYVVQAARAAGSLKICVVLGHQTEMVQDYLGKEIQTVRQAKLLGTADAVLSAAPFLKGYKGDVLILCGDTPLLRQKTIRSLVRRHKKEGADCTFLTTVVYNPSGYGRVLRGPDGTPFAIREHNDATEAEKNIREINVGVYCFKGDVLSGALKKIGVNTKKREYYLTDIIEILSEEGKAIATVETEDPEEGFGVNNRIDLAKAEGILRRRVLEEHMRNGVTIEDPSTTYIHADVKIGKDTLIRPLTVIEKNVRIGAHCVIGPFARLRPGTKIGDEAEIGNFTEVSRTKIGTKTLMKHFSFLGDATVGSRANIGAGTVTANYDGQSKNKTQISDGAFIGSDSILVAPVRIGKNARTGAGCVVTKNTNVPPGQTVLGVPGKILKTTSS